MATCKDCIHLEACVYLLNVIGYNVSKDQNREGAEKRCSAFTDKSRFVELPCKVGDVMYNVDPSFTVPIESKIYEICFRSGILAFRAARKGYFSIEFIESEIGKTVFLTREEAEAALAERTGE